MSVTLQLFRKGIADAMLVTCHATTDAEVTHCCELHHISMQQSLHNLLVQSR